MQFESNRVRYIFSYYIIHNNISIVFGEIGLGKEKTEKGECRILNFSGIYILIFYFFKRDIHMFILIL